MSFLNFQVYTTYILYFLQESEAVVRAVEESKTFGKLHERKIFKILKKYDNPTDFFIDINQGKLDSILNCLNSYKNLIQIGIEIKSERISDKNEVQKTHFMSQPKCMGH